MDEATIVEWLKKEGDKVEEGEVLYIVETDKTSLEVESTTSGVLEKILVEENQTIPPEAEICIIQSKSESLVIEKETVKQVETTPIKEDLLPIHLSVQGSEERIIASPAARKRARELNIDLGNVVPSKLGGRISLEDVERAANSRIETTPQVTKMRLSIAKEMLRSTQTIPAFWVEKWVNAEKLIHCKDRLKYSHGDQFENLTITDFLLQAIGIALKELPAMNRRWVVGEKDQIQLVEIQASHVGLAVSVEGGVLSPILPDMNRSLLEITKTRGNILEAIQNKQPYSSTKHAAITLSNLGNLGVDRFRAIIKPEESMILAVGRMEDKVLVEEGEIVIRKGFSMNLSADHRIIDGADAARFLSKVAEIIEAGKWTIS
jgi:pyruvate dehydrogenase E2 component (dihydrolipoamide acetyltransferase)